MNPVKSVFSRVGNLMRPYRLWWLRICPSPRGDRLRARAYARMMKRCGEINVAENVMVTGFENISIKDGTSFLRNSYVYAHDGQLSIGANCSINSNVQIGAAQGEIVMGDNVSVGPNTVLRAGIHNYERADMLIQNQGHRRGRIVIEDDVWISSNVVVNTDVTLGRGCVVGACSFVNEDVPPYAIVGGIPAKILGKRN